MNMNHENRSNRKLRYGSASVAITAVVIAVVVLLNVLLTALCSGKLWLIDLTPPGMYTLSDDGKRLLNLTMDSANENRAKRGEEGKAEVEIIFCADPDMLVANNDMRYIYYTALCKDEYQNEICDSRNDKYNGLYLRRRKRRTLNAAASVVAQVFDKETPYSVADAIE